jgi:hypothetical protein
MRRPKSKIAGLPAPIREEINRKLHDGWQLTTIAKWLFAQKTDRDIPDLDLKTGDPYALIWTRTARDALTAESNCRSRLSGWYRTHYRTWLAEEVETGQTNRIIDRVAELANQFTERDEYNPRVAGNFLIRSLLIDAIANARHHKNDPELLIRLTEAWSRLR